jgi:hypothetical protein
VDSGQPRLSLKFIQKFDTGDGMETKDSANDSNNHGNGIITHGNDQE